MRKCQQQKWINSDLTKIEFWSSFKNLINKCKSIESEKSTKTNYLCQKNEQLWSTYNQLICYFYFNKIAVSISIMHTY